MWRMGVPVATPVAARDIAAGIAGLWQAHASIDTFNGRIFALFGVRPAGLVNSGRAALYVTLIAMRRDSARDEVIIPAFICPSVARAVVKARLKAVLCDVTATGFGLDPRALERALTPRTLAVVTTHLFGYPSDVAPVLRLARAAGAMVIEDAAQAFGAATSGGPVGLAGDAGIFSFGLSKVLFAMGGGLIVANNLRLGEAIAAAVEPLGADPAWRQSIGLGRMAVIALLLRSHHLGPLSAVWAASFRGKHDTADFDVSRWTPAQAAVASSLLGRMAGITAARRRNACWYARELSGIPGLRLPSPLPDSAPAFLRFPIVVADPRNKSALIARLRKNGINASEMYDRDSYQAVCGLAAKRTECGETEYLIERMLNLPTHAFIDDRDRERIRAAFHLAGKH